MKNAYLNGVLTSSDAVPVDKQARYPIPAEFAGKDLWCSDSVICAEGLESVDVREAVVYDVQWVTSQEI